MDVVSNYNRAHELLLSFDNPDAWHVVEKKGNLLIKELKQAKGEVPLFEAVSLITVPDIRQLLYTGMLDPAAISLWAGTYDLNPLFDKPGNPESQNPGENPLQITLQKHSAILGGLISGREFLCARSYQTYPDGGFFFWTASVKESDWPADPTLFPQPSPGMVRGNLLLNAFLARPMYKQGNNDVVQLQYILQTDIGGHVPTWLTRKGVLHEMTQTFEKLPESLKIVAGRQREAAP
jgi:hypothetical protein